jgi:predicted NAD-dependent protein-ADP-ribosyltransferase YbiA (DUF1768 family)
MSNTQSKTRKKEPPLDRLYTNDDVFVFYPKSSNKFLPGFGVGEKIKMTHTYPELAKIEDWRRKLSNYWHAEFKLDGLRWLTVEHYYQASKFKKNNHAFYLQFSLNSGSDLSKDPSMAHSAGTNSGRVNNKKFRNPDIQIDDDFVERSEKELFRAQYCKFKQNKDLKHILLKTGNAKLVLYRLKGKPSLLYKGAYLYSLFIKKII